MLRVIVVAGVSLFLVKVYIQAWNIAIALLVMSVFCIPQDSGMLVYPLIIIVGSLFFGKRAIPVLTLASIGSLAVVAYLEIKGHIHLRAL